MAFKATLVLLQKVIERNIIATGLFLIKIHKQIKTTNFYLLC